MKYGEYINIVEQNIEKYKEDLVEINDYLALHPEPSGYEKESSKRIVDYLRSKGFKVEYPFCGFDYAFHATFGNQNHSHNAGIFCEYDALPELGHACGHCLSGSISILAAVALTDLQDDLDCNIHIFGSPLEEVSGSKMVFAEQGYFDGFELATMVHMYNKNVIAPTLIALDSYYYTFHGKIAHAAVNPWDGNNALNALQLMFHGMDMLRQHVKPDVRLHSVIKNGGVAANIIPEVTTAEVYVRAPKFTEVVEAVKKVDACAEGGAIATGCTWEKERTAEPYYEVKPNSRGHKILEEVYEELGLETVPDDLELFGSTDAGSVSYVCPTFHPCLKVVEEDVLIHSREFANAMTTERAHNILVTGAQIISRQIVKVFTDKSALEEMMKDYR